MPPLIRIENLHHTYAPESKRPVLALRGVDLTIAAGEFVVILGHNGSGKSTLARHLNALLLPAVGDVWVRNWNTKDGGATRDIRRTVGMVFQHPDNQIVATIVEEDVAFGPENLGVPRAELLQRVDWSLTQVDMQRYRHRAPHLLSGGQKQRICIAGVLAMQPEVLVLDEATAMLDPLGRREVLEVAHRLNKEQGVTVIAVTHFMREAVAADRIVVMVDGQIALQGPPRAIFQQIEHLRALQLDAPHISALAIELHRRFPAFPPDLLTPEEVVAAVENGARGEGRGELLIVDGQLSIVNDDSLVPRPSAPLITLQHLDHYYMRGTPLAVKALEDVSLDVRRGEIVGILGHTGSGKSTAIQHFNGLMRPHGGSVTVLDQDMADPKTDLRAIRRRVGLVFQQPEAQLFEQYVGDDVAFGPRKLGLDREAVRARVKQAMEAVGLDFVAFKDRQTFGLSGGQMRRVALAGVLALQPEVLVLDEPTAGLDPQARRNLLEHIRGLRQQGITLVIISHNMEELAELCDYLYVIAAGRTVMEGPPAVIFGQADRLRSLGLDVPDVTAVIEALRAANIMPPGAAVYTVQQAVDAIAPLLGPA